MRHVSFVLVLIGVLGAASAAVAAASGWSIQNTPHPKGATLSELYGVACTSRSACTAVGTHGKGAREVMLGERWNGTKWSIQNTPNPKGATFGNPNGVACTSKDACTAVGFYQKGTKQVTLVERWNGTKWSIQHTPNPKHAKGTLLVGVSCISKSACTAVGWYVNRTKQVTLVERWNGTKWSIQTTPKPTGATLSNLYGVSCTSGSACSAVGVYEKGSSERTLVERWNGTKWSIQNTPNPSGTTLSELDGVACTSDSTCTAVGYYGNGTDYRTLAERWNGTKWSIQHTPNAPGATSSELLGASCISNATCTAVGDHRKGTTYRTLAERWNGG